MSRQEFLDTMTKFGALQVFPSFAGDGSFVLHDESGEMLFLRRGRPNPDGVLIWVPLKLDNPVPMDIELG
jgi:hypothetical protein